MAKNRWPIIVGAVILVLMLITGTFSIGVYIGRYGLGAERQRNPPEAGGSLIAPNAVIPAQGAGNRSPDILGILRGQTGDSLELLTQGGLRVISVDEKTRLFNERGSELALDSLKRGDILAVFGIWSDTAGHQFMATHLVRIPPRLQDNP